MIKKSNWKFKRLFTLCSLKTLKLRMKEHMANGIIVAKFLESHSLIEKVISPALQSHPQHRLALKQQYGHSGMVSFYLKGMCLCDSWVNQLRNEIYSMNIYVWYLRFIFVISYTIRWSWRVSKIFEGFETCNAGWVFGRLRIFGRITLPNDPRVYRGKRGIKIDVCNITQCDLK